MPTPDAKQPDAKGPDDRVYWGNEPILPQPPPRPPWRLGRRTRIGIILTLAVLGQVVLLLIAFGLWDS